MISTLHFADEPADIPHEDSGLYLPAVGLKRMRELVARYPDFAAERD